MPSSTRVERMTTGGFEPPRNTQFSVFLDNRVGKLLELVEIFEGQALSLAGLSVLDSTDFAVARLITSRSELARRLLKRHEFHFSELETLVIELRGEQTLASMCKCLIQAEINIHHAYPLLISPRGAAAVALHTDDLELAGAILRKKLYTLLGENDLGTEGTPGDASEGPTTV